MMELVIDPAGTIRCLYGESIDLPALGIVQITRASHVEPDEHGRWRADLTPVGGPVLGPFDRRSQALVAETDWLAGALEAGSLSPGNPYPGATHAQAMPHDLVRSRVQRRLP